MTYNGGTFTSPRHTSILVYIDEF